MSTLRARPKTPLRGTLDAGTAADAANPMAIERATRVQPMARSSAASHDRRSWAEARSRNCRGSTCSTAVPRPVSWGPLLLTVATVFIFAAFALSTVGVWAEKVGGRLRWWHAITFWLGFVCDTTGTGAMGRLAGGVFKNTYHGITGTIAIALMLFHAVWATIVVVRRDERTLVSFHKFSVVVWIVWLVPPSGHTILGAAINLLVDGKRHPGFKRAAGLPRLAEMIALILSRGDYSIDIVGGVALSYLVVAVWLARYRERFRLTG